PVERRRLPVGPDRPSARPASLLLSGEPAMTFPATPLFAFLSFGAQGMLAGLGLASLPIIIHLLHRRRFKQTDWSAMEWLLEAIRKKARLLQFEQWLLLAVRTLLVVAVVLAMAKPVQNAILAFGGPAFGDKPVTHTIVVFDNSMSMHYTVAGQSRWE